MLELLIALLIGIIAGTFTGLAPGIHINLIAAILVSSVSKFSFINPLPAAIFVVSMSITHTFLDFIPSIYLGAPEEDNFLSILPGHEMFLEGKAHSAVVYTLYGSIAAIFVSLFLIPFFIKILPLIYDPIKSIIPFLLIFISSYLILREDKILLSFFVFSLSGALGLLVFNNPVKEPLLPLLSGIFGLSNLFISINSNQNYVKQSVSKLKEIKMSFKEITKSIIPTSFTASICSFLPGLSSGHAATIASEIVPQNRKGFLFMVGATNTIIMALSFITVFSIGKTRSGSAAAIKDLLLNITNQDILIIIITIIISGIISLFLGIKISISFSKLINKINYKKISIITIIILFLVNIIFTNYLGILVLITSTALGIFTILLNSRRINLMGCLIVPVIFYYLL